MSSEGFKETDIGLIPEDWGFLSLGNICNIQMGQSPPSKYYNIESKGLPFFQGRKDFGNKYPKVTIWCSKPNRIAEEGDVLLSLRAPVGDINVSKEKCCIGRGLSSVAMKNNNNEFIYYLFQYNKKRLKDIFESEGTVFGCITKKGLHDFKVAVPPEQEQSKIAKILSQFDQKIEINHQMNQTLEQIGQSIFRHWFVHFEFPDDEGRPYKSSGGEMVDSELGEIPKGWEVGKLGDVISITSGKRPLKKSDTKINDFVVPLIGASSLMGFVKEILYHEPILVIGRVGTHGIVQRVLPPSHPSDNTLVIKSNFHEFVYQILKRIDYESLNVGTTQPLITQKSIKNLEIIIPTEKILNNYEEIVSKLFFKLEANKHENNYLSKIRDTLLPKLMSGKIRVNIPEEGTVK